MTSAGIRIGIDIGGTFTDLQVLDERTGAQTSFKTPTTPADPSVGLMTGIDQAARRLGFALGDIRFLLHGTTIATNAVLEKRLPRGVLLATEGFSDVLEIGRHARRDVYGLKPTRPEALVPRDRRLGVAERMRADGSVERALTPDAVARALAAMGALAPEAVAVALLHAHVNPAHERMLRDAIAAAHPGLPVSLSSEVSPEVREYERTSTTVLNALLIPVVKSYLDRLTARMAERGMTARLLLVQSNGGVCTADVASAQPARLLLSGPSGGALGARKVAGRLAERNLVGIDMGGTSFDVCVVRDGDVTLMTQGEVDSLPVRLPMVEIRTVGAGGGSIASVEAGGRLMVGPRSAGARPGPVCYGHGGLFPTVTDANLLLGRLDPAYFLGGAFALHADAAVDAMRTHVGDPLGLDTERAAEGVLTLTNANLASAIRLSLFEKGLDPRRFALLSFGGAGGLHAIPVADELGVDRVIFPSDASTFSASGILFSDIVHDVARSRLMRATPNWLPDIGRACEDLRRAGDALLEQDGIAREPARPAVFGRHALPRAGVRVGGALGRRRDAGRGGADAAGRRFSRAAQTALLVREPRRFGGDRHDPPDRDGAAAGGGGAAGGAIHGGDGRRRAPRVPRRRLARRAGSPSSGDARPDNRAGADRGALHHDFCRRGLDVRAGRRRRPAGDAGARGGGRRDGEPWADRTRDNAQRADGGGGRDGRNDLAHQPLHHRA